MGKFWDFPAGGQVGAILLIFLTLTGMLLVIHHRNQCLLLLHNNFLLNLVFLLVFFFLNKFILFIYSWLCWVFVAVCGLSLVAASRGYSSLRCAGFSLRWLLLLRSTGSRHAGFSSCGTRAQ